MSDLLRGNAEFHFDREQKQSFIVLKNLFSKEPVLRIYDPNAIIELHTAASAEGYGGTLMQRKPDEKNFHPVYYWSRKTLNTNRNYHSYELEILTIVRALQKFKVYLLGLSFTIVTDYETVHKTLMKKDLTSKIARWALSLEEFSYKIVH